MLEKNFEADADLLEVLVSGLCSKGRVDSAYTLVTEMKQKYPPFPEPFEDFISKFGTVDDAKEFLTALSVTQYPSFSAYLHLLKAFFKEGRQSEARDLLYKCPHHIRNHADVSILFASPKEGNVIATA
ncbi:Pentatricopeptide repeat-containing protein [Thalictrum thalictroides]|uniref:Pentatricopeptide repeat-containing protein n=1 Tax=Thalictrum thalictroides TaxID=46969 RepID=A0A7J6VHQ5_THATH|nr:Pentatricopeptide repeat-containing protein [Thalictrum thalictroides]